MQRSSVHVECWKPPAVQAGAATTVDRNTLGLVSGNPFPTGWEKSMNIEVNKVQKK